MLTLPALRTVGQWLGLFSNPTPITLLGRDVGREIFPRVLPVERFIHFEDNRLLPLFSPSEPIPKATYELFGRPDVAIIWLRQYRPLAEKLRQAGCRFVMAGDSFPADEDTHVADHLQSLLTPLGVAGPEDDEVTPVSEAERQAGLRLIGERQPSGPIALVHPGSGSPPKNWPAARFAQLIDRLAAQGWDWRILKGPADEQAVGDLLREIGLETAPAVEPASVSELCGVLSAAGLVVSNDSGVAHLSAAIGRPTVAIFGPTNARWWAPRGPLAIAVTPAAAEPWPTVDEVASSCEKALELAALKHQSCQAKPIKPHQALL